MPPGRSLPPSSGAEHACRGVIEAFLLHKWWRAPSANLAARRQAVAVTTRICLCPSLSQSMQVEVASAAHKHAAEVEALRQELGTERAQLAAAQTAQAHAQAAAAQASATHDPAPALQVRADASPASNTRRMCSSDCGQSCII